MEIATMKIANLVPAARPLLGAVALTAAMALPAFAQDAAPAAPEVAEALIEANTQTKFILNSFLMLFGGILVFWMAAGFAMLEAGFVRSKNVSMQLLKNITMYSLACFA